MKKYYSNTIPQYYYILKSFNFVGIKVCGLMMVDIFVDTWAHELMEVQIIHKNIY